MLNRRDAMALGAAGTLYLRDALHGARASAGAPPNILFILADDLGYADLSCYGAPTIRTPALDQLARHGMRFVQSYANSAVCSASRTALITGRYQYRLPVGLEEPLNDSVNPTGLPPEVPTLPSQLKKAGYQTALVGKWHLGALPEHGPLQSGYEHFWGFRGGALDYFSHTDPGGGPDLWQDNVPVSQQGYLTELLGQRASELVQSMARARRPFLLSLHFNAPHWPWEGAADQAESNRLKGHSLFDFDGGTLKTYAAMVEAMDAQIARVLQTLERAGAASNTIVIFSSDNGGERFSDTWPFTGRKTELLEGGLRVPALVRWPARVPAGHVNEQVIITMDWMPTLLAAAGSAMDPAFPSDGMNLLPTLTQSGAPISRKLFWRYKANAQRAVRDGDYKVLKIAGNSFLFNVVQDPLERANLKQREPQIFERLKGEWDQWNRDMLPEIAKSFTDNFTGSKLADHINTPAIVPTAVDDATGWP